MKKLLLIDGNNMLFKAYHATLYGRMMTTSNGIPTNAVFGFIHMIQKALQQIQPDYVLVAWDSGKPTFRHEHYKEYKGTRKEVDEALIVQFPIVREYLDAYGLYRYECDGIEADDIIGTMAKGHPDYEIHILSSDKDLWQLIDSTTDIYVMKKGLSEIEVINEHVLKEKMGLVPQQIVDLKALMGDASDNIPGVPGVGEKTALKLLAQYETLENVYAHVFEIKGKLKEKIVDNKDKAFMSKFLATIKTDAPLPFQMDDLKYHEPSAELYDFYRKYEMNSLLKEEVKEEKPKLELSFQVVSSLSEDMLHKETVLWADHDCENYYDTQLYGFGVGTNDTLEYISLEDAKKDAVFLAYLKGDDRKITIDAKMLYHICSCHGLPLPSAVFDSVIAAFLLDGSINDYDKLLDRYQLHSGPSKEEVYGKKGKPKLVDEDSRLQYVKTQMEQLLSIKNTLVEGLCSTDMMDLFEELEMPLTKVLFKMEENGVCTDPHVLDDIAIRMSKKIDEISAQIYEIAGYEFNINSPKQLAVVLYDELGLKAGKKRSTAVDVLEKFIHVHPIISLLMEHRKYAKIYSTYAVGLSKHIQRDGKIHTIFNQTLTQTGRLSSSEPNLQNISVRDEEGKEVRKAFVASEGHVLMSADYSQIELRMLAHMADEREMIEAFLTGIDIHTKTAMEIYDVSAENVTDAMRRNAKTVNFGIVYGQSEYGLSEQLAISRAEAKRFIEKYFSSYPKIKIFMDDVIEYCKEHGYVKTLFNRRRYIPEIRDKNHMTREFGKRAAMNAPIQGSAADLIKKAMILIDRRMQEEHMKSTMILQIHDELIFDVAEDEIDAMKQLIEDGMQHAMCLRVPLIAEANYARSWYDAK